MTQEVETIQFLGKTYRLDSVTEDGRGLWNDIITIENERKRQEVSLSITKIAKEALIKQFIEESQKFVEVKDPEPAVVQEQSDK